MENNKQLYIGTLSDEAVINSLKEIGDILISGKTDTEIKNLIDNGFIKDCFHYFFAKDINEACKHAKQMDLKNFSQVCGLYKKGENY